MLLQVDQTLSHSVVVTRSRLLDPIDLSILAHAAVDRLQVWELLR